jgi:GNAT superfamily N-acetyltransferase
MMSEGPGPARGLPARVAAPQRLTAQHDVSSFESGKHPTLDQWLRERALTSEGLSARTYVICATDSPRRVVGYYAIATAMEQRVALPSAKLRRGMPERVPFLLLARLAVDRSFQGMGLGAHLLSDALRRCLSALVHEGLSLMRSTRMLRSFISGMVLYYRPSASASC